MIKRKDNRPKAAPKRSRTPLSAQAPDGKLRQLEMMLRRVEGATLPQLMEALSWQAHSIRGAMSGSLKKRRSLKIESTKEVGKDRVYRIME